MQKQELPCEIWYLASHYCEWPCFAHFFQLNKTICNYFVQNAHLFQNNDGMNEYKLRHMIHLLFVDPYNAATSIIHIPSRQFVCQFNVDFWLFVKKIMRRYDEEIHAVEAKNRLLTSVLCNLAQCGVPSNDAEDALVLMMKYLPWDPVALQQHPIAQVQTIAQIGMQLVNAKVGSFAMVEQVVSNYADYAQCLVECIPKQQHFKTLGTLLNEFPKCTTQEAALAAARTGNPIQVFPLSNNVHPEIMRVLGTTTYGFYRFDNHFLSNIDFIMQAVLTAPTILSRQPALFQDNDSVLANALKHGKYDVLLYASERLQRKHLNYYLMAVRATKNLRLPRSYCDDELIVRAFIISHAENILSASFRVQSVQYLALLAIRMQPKLYKKLPQSIKHDKQVLCTLLQHDKHATMYMPNTVMIKFPQLKQVQHFTLQKQTAMQEEAILQFCA